MRYLFPRHDRSGRYCGFHSLSSLLLQNRSAFLPGMNVRCPFPASNGSILLIGKTAGIFNARHLPLTSTHKEGVQGAKPISADLSPSRERCALSTRFKGWLTEPRSHLGLLMHPSTWTPPTKAAPPGQTRLQTGG